ncbi:MAG: NAD(P)/FAD-dependent oxidoreductase [Rubrivivax sp.]
MDSVDALVIGAGVVGLAAGRALALAGLDTVVVESAAGIGQGVSSRNSEVLHAGLYYPPGSFKARLCVQGRDQLQTYCAERGVPHAVCGKLVVATAQDQHAALDALRRRALTNGVAIEAWDAARAREMEPALDCTAALWSPATGIVDSHALMLSLLADLEAAGGVIALKSTVVSMQGRATGPVRLQVRASDGEIEIEADRVVNAAGLQACAVAAACQGMAADTVPRARYAKGNYFTLAGASPFRHLIYPAPVDAWLGVHLTLDLAGHARFGPDLEWLATDDPEAIDYAVDARRGEAFVAAIRRYWPGLPDGALLPDYSGVRPKIHGPGDPAPDFRIDGPQQHGVAGLVNLYGIESPGLTAAMALADRVVGLLHRCA